MKVWWCGVHNDHKADAHPFCWQSDETSPPCQMVEMELHPAGSRVVTAEALVIEKVDGEWPEWAEGNAAEAISYDAPNTAGREVLDWMLRMDALAQSKDAL